MKDKCLLAIISLAIIIFLFPTASFADENQAIFTIGGSRYLTNGQSNQMDALPFIENDRSFVPIRYLALALGISEDNIKWCPEEQKVVMAKDGIVLELIIGSNNLFINGNESTIDIAPVIINGRTYLPARFVAEAFGYEVGWDDESKTVLVGQPGNLPEPEGPYFTNDAPQEMKNIAVKLTPRPLLYGYQPGIILEYYKSEPGVHEPDFSIHYKYSYDITISGTDEDTLNKVLIALQEFFPNHYQEVFEKVKESIDNHDESEREFDFSERLCKIQWFSDPGFLRMKFKGC